MGFAAEPFRLITPPTALVHVTGVLKNSSAPSASMLTDPLLVQGFPIPLAALVTVVAPLVVSVPVPAIFAPPDQLNAPLIAMLPDPPSATASPPFSVTAPSAVVPLKLTVPPPMLTGRFAV